MLSETEAIRAELAQKRGELVKAGMLAARRRRRASYLSQHIVAEAEAAVAELRDEIEFLEAELRQSEVADGCAL